MKQEPTFQQPRNAPRPPQWLGQDNDPPACVVEDTPVWPVITICVVVALIAILGIFVL
jgi:hypothetical protein